MQRARSGKAEGFDWATWCLNLVFPRDSEQEYIGLLLGESTTNPGGYERLGVLYTRYCSLTSRRSHLETFARVRLCPVSHLVGNVSRSQVINHTGSRTEWVPEPVPAQQEPILVQHHSSISLSLIVKERKHYVHYVVMHHWL